MLYQRKTPQGYYEDDGQQIRLLYTPAQCITFIVVVVTLSVFLLVVPLVRKAKQEQQQKATRAARLEAARQAEKQLRQMFPK